MTLTLLPGDPDRGAHISDDGRYRYLLWRQLEWVAAGDERTALFVMLNPSTADATTDDHTIRRCMFYARREGCHRLEVVNLYALRSTDPKQLLTADDPVGPENRGWFRASVTGADLIVVAWGGNKMAPNLWPVGPPPRPSAVARAMKRIPPLVIELAETATDYGAKCLGLTSHGFPRHPSRLGNDVQLEPFP